MSGSHPRCLQRHSGRTLHQVSLQIEEFAAAVWVGFGTHRCHAAAQTALQAADRLPFETIDRVTSRVALRNGVATQAFASEPVVTVATAQVDLPDALGVERLAARL